MWPGQLKSNKIIWKVQLKWMESAKKKFAKQHPFNVKVWKTTKIICGLFGEQEMHWNRATKTFFWDFTFKQVLLVQKLSSKKEFEMTFSLNIH